VDGSHLAPAHQHDLRCTGPHFHDDRVHPVKADLKILSQGVLDGQECQTVFFQTIDHR
jgi:hypothetical protein